MSLNHSSDLYKEERFRVGKFACEICGGEFPITHLRLQSGLHVGVMCCWEATGGELERDRHRYAVVPAIAARLSAKELQPPQFGGEAFYGTEPVPQLISAVTSVTPNPVILTRGGAAVPVVLGGVNFVAADSIVYGNAGITDAAPPALVSSAEWDLSVHASVGMPVGRYPATFNGTAWQSVFDVR